MGWFSKKELTPSEEIDLLKQKEKILRTKKEYTPIVLNKLIIFFLCLASGLFAWFDFKPHISVGVLLLISILLFLYKPYSNKKLSQQIKQTRELKNQKAEELKESIKSVGKLYEKFKGDEMESKKTYMDYKSYPAMCQIWDKMTGGYIYNPKALICPICKSNNGLYDMSKPIRYICPNCKNLITANYQNSAAYLQQKKDD